MWLKVWISSLAAAIKTHVMTPLRCREKYTVIFIFFIHYDIIQLLFVVGCPGGRREHEPVLLPHREPTAGAAAAGKLPVLGSGKPGQSSVI